MRYPIVLLALAVLLAGCTSPPTDGGGSPRSTALPEIEWPANAISFSSARSSRFDARWELMAVPAGGGRAVAIDVPVNASVTVGELAWSADGSRVAFVSGPPRHVLGFAGDGYLYVMDATGAHARRVTSRPNVSWPTWSPDGTQIAVVRDQGTELVVMNVDGTDAYTVARRRGYYQLPSWSPDGRWIAFQSSPDPSSERVTPAIYRIHSDGTGARRLTSASTSEGFPAWSPDGSAIAYSAGERLWMMDRNGSNPVQLTHCDEPCLTADRSPTWSPDGRSLAFIRQDETEGTDRLIVMELAAGRTRVLKRGLPWIVSPAWRP